MIAELCLNAYMRDVFAYPNEKSAEEFENSVCTAFVRNCSLIIEIAFGSTDRSEYIIEMINENETWRMSGVGMGF